MRILLKTPIDSASGYGNDGLGLARALERLGNNVMLFPMNVAPPIPLEVASMLTKDYEPPFDLAIVHSDPSTLYVDEGTIGVSFRTVGWSMWEWEEFKPAGYTPKGLKKRLKPFDHLFCYDAVTEKALSPWIPAGVSHSILQGGYWAEDWPFLERDWFDGPFRFLMVGQLHSRKDPFAAIEAFNHLKLSHGDDFNAELHLKTNVGGLHPAMEDAYPGLFIYHKYWDHAKMLELYRRCHVLLAPSKGEGKNLPALEMLSTGGTVIATDFGGHKTWLHEDYAYKLNYELVDFPGEGHAARADKQHLADLMWRTYTERGEARQKGLVGARTVPAMFDWTPVARRLLDESMKIAPRQIAANLG